MTEDDILIRRTQLEIIALIEERGTITTSQIVDFFTSVRGIQRDTRTFQRWLKEIITNWNLPVSSGKHHRFEQNITPAVYQRIIAEYFAVLYLDKLITPSLSNITIEKRQVLINLFNIQLGIDRHFELDLEYRKEMTGKRETVKRRIRPLELVYRYPRWILVLQDTDSGNQIKTFYFDNIVRARRTEQQFKRPPFMAHAYFKYSWGHYVSDEIYTVKMRMTGKAAALVQKDIYHSTQKIQLQKDGSVIFSVQIAGLYEFIPFVLKWGTDAEVLQPPELITLLRNTAERLTEIYCNKP